MKYLQELLNDTLLIIFNINVDYNYHLLSIHCSSDVVTGVSTYITSLNSHHYLIR